MPETIEKSFFNSPEYAKSSETVERSPEVAKIQEVETDDAVTSKLGPADVGRALADAYTALQRHGEQLSPPHAEIEKVSRRLADFRVWEQELHNTDTEANADFALWEAEMTQSSLDNYELTHSKQ